MTLENLSDLLQASGHPDPIRWLHQATSPLDVESYLKPLATVPSTNRAINRTLPSAARSLVTASGNPYAPIEGEIASIPLRGTTEDFIELRSVRDPKTALGFIEPLGEQLRIAPDHAASLALVLATEVAKGLTGGNAHLFCEAVGVYASAQKFLGFNSDAARLLRLVLPIAAKIPHYGLAARLYRRSAAVVSDQLQYEAAIAIATEAISLTLKDKQYSTLPRILVDLGAYLLLDGQYRDCIGILTQAISGLPKDDSLHLSAAYISLGAAQLALEDPSSALQAFHSADRHTDPRQHHTRACILNQIAVVHTSDGNLATAVETYREAALLFAENNPVEHAYVSADLMALLIRMGRFSEAREVASQISFMLAPITDQSPLVAKILALTMKIATAGTLVEQSQLERLSARLSELCRSHPLGQA